MITTLNVYWEAQINFGHSGDLGYHMPALCGRVPPPGGERISSAGPETQVKIPHGTSLPHLVKIQFNSIQKML